MPKGEKTPIQPDQAGVKGAAAHEGEGSEELSVEKLKAELFDREVPEEYRRIINEFEPGFVSRSSEWLPGMELPVHSKQMREFLERKFHGKTLFDLGCGSTGRPWGVGVAKKYGAGRYVGVDLYSWQKGASQVEGLEYYLFGQEDMLAFVSRIKSHAGGAYLISGVEPNRGDWGTKFGKSWDERLTSYYNALATELSRTINDGDVVVFLDVYATTHDFLDELGPEKYGFHRVEFAPDSEGLSTGTRIYEKAGKSKEKE